MTLEERWVRFACAALAGTEATLIGGPEATEYAAKQADRMVAEFARRFTADGYRPVVEEEQKQAEGEAAR